MPTIIDTLIVRLRLDSSDYDSGKEKAKKGLKETGDEAEKSGKRFRKAGDETGKSFDGMGKAAVKFLAIIGGTYAIKRFIEQTVESSAALDRFSKNLGQSADIVSAWSNASEIAGGTGQGLQGTMSMLSRAQTELALTGQSSLIPYFSALSISMADASGRARPVTDILLDLADRFSRMDRTRAFNMGQMMGIDPGTMNLLLQGRSELETLISRQKQQNAVTKQQAEESSRVREKIVRLHQSFEAFGRGLLSDSMPILEKVLGWFESFGKWCRENKEIVETFLTVLAAGIGAVVLAALPISGTIVAILALAAAIALLWEDYQVWKKGGESFIPWAKWESEIKNAIKFIKDLKKEIQELIETLNIDFGKKWDKFLDSLDPLITKDSALRKWIDKHSFNHSTDEDHPWRKKWKNFWESDQKYWESDEAYKKRKEREGVNKKESSAEGEPSGTSGLAGTPFGKLIARGEGSYNIVNTGKYHGYKAKVVDLENMTVAEVMKAQAEGQFNAAGRYQTIKGTLKSAVKELGLTGKEKFNRATQDRIFEQYLAGIKRPAIADYLSGKSDDLKKAQIAAAQEWASVADPRTGKSYYAGDGINKASISSKEMAAALKNSRKALMEAKASKKVTESAAPVVPPVAESKPSETIVSAAINSGISGTPNASQFAQSASAPQVAESKAAEKGGSATAPNVDKSVETHVGTIQVITQATDADGIAKDIGKSMDYLSFGSQANYGLI